MVVTGIVILNVALSLRLLVALVEFQRREAAAVRDLRRLMLAGLAWSAVQLFFIRAELLLLCVPLCIVEWVLVARHGADWSGPERPVNRMRRLWSWLTLVIAVLLALAVIGALIAEPAAVPADEPPGESFLDDFGRTEELPELDAGSCQAYHSGGQLHLTESSSGRVCYRAYHGRYDEFDLEVDLGRISGGGKSGGTGAVIFGIRDERNYFVFGASRLTNVYILGRVRDGRLADSQVRPAGSPGGVDPEAPMWAHVHIVTTHTLDGMQIRTYAGGAPVLLAIAPDWQPGLIGLFVENESGGAHVAFDNLSVKVLPPSSPFPAQSALRT